MSCFEICKCLGRYENVLSLHSGVSGDYVLRGHLYDLREIDGKALVARVTFEFDMRDVKTGNPVWSRYYSHDEPVSRRDVSAVVEAMDRNVQRGLNEVTDDLDRYFLTILRALPLRSVSYDS